MKVSVSITTFNQEPYIAAALDGILMQEADFDYEIIVGEDCSSDGTRSIVEEYERRYPYRIKSVLPEQNLGGLGKRIFAETLKLCRGEYIACMDGDDYWTSPHKLQKQVEFLERYTQCSMCFHDVMIMHEDSSLMPRRFVSSHRAMFSDPDDLFAGCFIPACSPVFRRHALVPLPSWYFNLPSGDWSLYLIAGEQGKIGYLDEVMGVYRVHRGGMWSGADPLEQLDAVVCKYVALNSATQYRYNSQIHWALSDAFLRIAKEHAKAGDVRLSQKYAFAALCKNPAGRRLNKKQLLIYLLKPYLQWLLRVANSSRRGSYKL